MAYLACRPGPTRVSQVPGVSLPTYHALGGPRRTLGDLTGSGPVVSASGAFNPSPSALSLMTGLCQASGRAVFPDGLRDSLCTLQLCRSALASFTAATLGRSGWLGLTPQGLAPCKNTPSFAWRTNATAQPLPEAGATQERTLEAVRCSALLGFYAATQPLIRTYRWCAHVVRLK